MSETVKPYLVRRNCTRKSGNEDEQGTHPLESYRELPAYVLLGDPGAGKTAAFEREAEESGGKYIKARVFAAFEPTAEDTEKTLFIDALDEMRAGEGDGWTSLAQVSKRLGELGCPRFRLSCREADWLGESDSATLKRISPNGDVVALHLDPLSNSDVIDILRHKDSVPDPNEFIRNAGEHRLGDLLHNPQTLNLLVEAVGGNKWPKSRKGIYEMACHQLVREESRAHRDAKREKHHSPEALLDAAGYMCAIQLLSGIAGFALDKDASDDQHYYWNELSGYKLPLLPALKTNLFQKDEEEQRVPIHRSVAEYLGARHLAARIEDGGLPFGRVLALISGEDGGMVPDLRGFAAWLSVHCRTGRSDLIARDPLGVVLYGDVRNFIVDDKRLVLNALKNEALRYPWFRSQDWTSPPFGALGTADMESAFREILISPSRAEADQALLDCVLDAIRHGDPLPSLSKSLETIARDASYWPAVRTNAAQALMHAMQDNSSRLLKLAEDIREGTVEDREDELLGALLRKLYPTYIPPAKILDYLHKPKNESLIGNYFMLWTHEIPEITAIGDLPLLLDQLIQKHADLRKMLQHHQLNRMLGKLLVRGLETHGDSISDERLYDWLGIGLDEYGHARLEREHSERIANWLAGRPNRYKAIIERGATLCVDQENVRYCMSRCAMRLPGTPPSDIGIWYLKKAALETSKELAQYFFYEAVYMLKRDGGQQELTDPALKFLESWVNAYPIFQPWLEWFTTCPIGEWQQEQAIQSHEWNTEQKKQKVERVGFYRKHLNAIRNGNAYPQILHDLAQAYNGLIYEATGETPRERLEDFLNGDKDLVEAAYSGFRHILDRKDLPTVSEIVELDIKGKMPYVRTPCLVGIDELFQNNPTEAMRLDDSVLSRLLAFRFTYDVGENPEWINALIRTRSALVAEVLVAYALPKLRAGNEHVSGLYPLAYNDVYSEVARIALPLMLEGFPLRARKQQLGHALDPLLKGALNYLDKRRLASIIDRKLELGSMDAAQRVYWLACGLIVDPAAYAAKLFQYVGKSRPRKSHLAAFLHDRWERGFPYAALPETVLARLIELLLPSCTPERPVGTHWVSTSMNTADLMRSFINKLGGSPSETASRELERLLALSSLTHWHTTLRGALHDQRIARRKSTFRRLGVEEVSRTLANLQPASAADLAALTFDHLRDIARKIRDGSTNDYRQYWSYDISNKILNKPKPENDCRDALLSDLKARLSSLGIDAEREGNYADDKRADIKVLFGGANGFNVPIEIKKDTHDDLWRAIHEQLIPKYIRDPGAEGYGIYLVFWFGGKGMKPPLDGKKLHSALELEDRLCQTLTTEESHRIHICVIDCALPT
ncbi:hypothetical protein [Sideroxydans sp. CL21]|uniref:NACHT domain-containing protein n=1 Tax=Sideroxydans sp. CL21 TaxID=2600596 RepID=UPI0012A946FB|nr:hypothetical protein [Sideroxydans sp. CL21]VVC85455.1 hypothetical protein [Sideroxydans sp. CL21]